MEFLPAAVQFDCHSRNGSREPCGGCPIPNVNFPPKVGQSQIATEAGSHCTPYIAGPRPLRALIPSYNKLLISIYCMLMIFYKTTD